MIIYIHHHGSTYQAYTSFRRLCKDHQLDPTKVTKDHCPFTYSKGTVIALPVDERI